MTAIQNHTVVNTDAGIIGVFILHQNVKGLDRNG